MKSSYFHAQEFAFTTASRGIDRKTALYSVQRSLPINLVDRKQHYPPPPCAYESECALHNDSGKR